MTITTHLRSAGHTAAAALAYRFGASLRDALGEPHTYTARQRAGDIGACQIITARTTPLAASPQALADGIESAERRCDARILRDITIGLPRGLRPSARTQLATDFTTWLAEHYDTVLAVAIHRPDPAGDQANHHAHIIMPTRALAADGRTFGRKFRALDLATQSGDEVARMRNQFTKLANAALVRARRAGNLRAGQILEGVVVPHAHHALVGAARAAVAKSTGRPVRGLATRDVIAAAVDLPDEDFKDDERATEIARAHRQRGTAAPRQERWAQSRRSRRARQAAAKRKLDRAAARPAAQAPSPDEPTPPAPTPEPAPTAPAPTPAEPEPRRTTNRKRRRRSRPAADVHATPAIDPTAASTAASGSTTEWLVSLTPDVPATPAPAPAPPVPAPPATAPQALNTGALAHLEAEAEAEAAAERKAAKAAERKKIEENARAGDPDEDEAHVPAPAPVTEINPKAEPPDQTIPPPQPSPSPDIAAMYHAATEEANATAAETPKWSMRRLSTWSGDMDEPREWVLESVIDRRQYGRTVTASVRELCAVNAGGDPSDDMLDSASAVLISARDRAKLRSRE